jgi:hypothetical protein
MTKKKKMQLSATYGKNNRPPLQTVPVLIIVAAPITTVEPGEPANVNANWCQCARCRYMARHTGNA